VPLALAVRHDLLQHLSPELSKNCLS